MKHRTKVPALAMALAVGLAACAASVETTLVEHSRFTLVAHDSAHVRQLVILPATGGQLDAATTPMLLLKSGERLPFAPEPRREAGNSLAMLHTLRVQLTTPVNGTLRVRICAAPANAEESANTDTPANADTSADVDTLACTTISAPVYTRTRSMQERR